MIEVNSMNDSHENYFKMVTYPANFGLPFLGSITK